MKLRHPQPRFSYRTNSSGSYCGSFGLAGNSRLSFYSPKRLRKAPRNPEPAKRCAAFLSNRREAIAAMDFFTMPTLTFGGLHCFFVIAHDRRRILQVGITKHPTGAWISQQLRETLPYDTVPCYLIFDRARNFNEKVVDTIKSF